MKKIFSWVILYAIFFSGCFKDDCISTVKIYTPVYKSLTEVRTNMKSLSPQPMQNTGKIYVYGKYIFLNEVNKGVHVIDNSNPSDPKNISFINIPGNVDLAVKGNYLYADSYRDLAVFDISNPRNITAKKFLDNVFPYMNIYYRSNTTNPDSILVPVDFIEKDTVVNCNTYNRWAYQNCINCDVLTAAPAYASLPSGMGGSMARFAVLGNYLYTVSVLDLSSFDISNASSPEWKSTSAIIGPNVETIYPFRDKLFIGSASGMYIYDASEASAPVQIGQFGHVNSCDPVIADDNNAFVTLRSGTECAGYTDQLEVMDITNITNPSLLKIYNMTNPHGLSKSGNWLFICDGKDGLKVYDASDVNNITLKKQIGGMETYDVITLNDLAMVVASDGLYQYDFSEIDHIKLLSKISIEK